jgi:hypothetical protein
VVAVSFARPGICGRFVFVHRYVGVELDVVKPTGT